jgi:Atypical PilZ domain, cyclic di-GMP receptor
MYEGIDTVVLYEELAYQDVVPLAWQTLTAPLSGEAQTQMVDRNLRVLQASAALEESGQVEKADENSPHAADILRLDMKVNLLLDLVGRILIANQPRPKPIPIRFNSQGATWKMAVPSCKPGDEGILEIYLKDCLVEPLRLVGRVVNVSAEGQIKVKFHSPGEAIADLIEKLAFRKHRRQVADSRQPRVDTARTGKFRR